LITSLGGAPSGSPPRCALGSPLRGDSLRPSLAAAGRRLSAERAPEDPHRITAVTIDFVVTGNVPKDQVQRAIDLSHEKYCSVWHSMRQDIAFTTTFSVGKVG